MPSPSNLLSSASRLIEQAERILLVSDGKPDGDSIGSMTAVLNWLIREGKHVEAFSIQTIPRSLLFLDQVHRVTSDPHVFTKPFDLVITFDASDPKRSGITDNLPRMPKPAHVIVFDHHVTNPLYGDTNIVFTEACSTCEVVYRFFDENHVRIDERMATSLLTGITTDTTSFSNSATNATGIEAAAELFRAGARHTDIVKHVVQNKSIDGLKLWGLALSRLQVNEKHDLATTYFLREDLQAPGSHEAVEGLSNFLQGACSGCDAVMVLREWEDGQVRGSLRSVRRDISKLAAFLGGGGHKKAAGFTVQGRIEVTPKGPTIVPT